MLGLAGGNSTAGLWGGKKIPSISGNKGSLYRLSQEARKHLIKNTHTADQSNNSTITLTLINVKSLMILLVKKLYTLIHISRYH